MNDLQHWLPTIIALLGVASVWGSNNTTTKELKVAVDKLTAKLDTIAALEKADSLHAQDATHQREGLATAQSEIVALHKQASALELTALRTTNRLETLERHDSLGHGLRGLFSQVAVHMANSNTLMERLLERPVEERRSAPPEDPRSSAPPFQPRRPTDPGKPR